MAYYSKVTDHKTRDQKRRSAEQRGGFDDEGTRYTGAKKSTGGARRKPAAGAAAGSGPRGYSRKTEGGEARPYRSRNANGDGYAKKPYGKQAEGAAASGGPRGYSRKTEGGEARPNRSRNTNGDGYAKKPYGKPAEGAAAGSGPRGYSRKTEGGEARPYRSRNANGDGYAKKPYGKPAEGGETRSYKRKPDSAKSRGSRKYSKSPTWSDPAYTPRGNDTYRSRGDGITPKPYSERRQEQRQTETRADFAPYRDDAYQDDAANENLLSGRNPIREALKSGRDIEKLMVSRGELSGSAKEIVAMAKQQRVPIQEVDRARLDAITPHHQGMLAFASAYQYHTVEEMLALAQEKGEKPFLVMLDGVTDPHNLGAVIRTAECAGAHGVIVQERRAVGLTPAAVKASAGAIEHIMVARVVNLTSTLDMLKKQDIWAYAADASGEDYTGVDYTGGAVIVIGAEGEGVSRLVLEKCDKTIALPMRGKIDSLNASVAAGILLYTVMRSR